MFDDHIFIIHRLGKLAGAKKNTAMRAASAASFHSKYAAAIGFLAFKGGAKRH
jgi:hypothetical protein